MTVSATTGGVSGSTGLSVTCRSHPNGLGQDYADCRPLGTPGNASTYTLTMAAEAGAASPYWTGNNGSVALCTNGAHVWIVQSGTTCAIWAYEGTAAGSVLVTTSAEECYPGPGATWK